MPARNQPTRVLPRHHVIMRLQSSGISPAEIADIIGISKQSIQFIINSDVYQAEYAKYNSTVDAAFVDSSRKVRQKISDMVSYGMDELDEILKDKATPKTLRANIIFELLDRDGYKAPKERESSMDYLDAMTRAYERKLAENSGENPGSGTQNS